MVLSRFEVGRTLFHIDDDYCWRGHKHVPGRQRQRIPGKKMLLSRQRVAMSLGGDMNRFEQPERLGFTNNMSDTRQIGPKKTK